MRKLSPIEDVKRMMLDKVPRKEIMRLTRHSANELCNFAKAWGIPAYGKPGPKRGGSIN